MNLFLRKHRLTILGLMILGIALLYFVTAQLSHYLETDIARFKSDYFVPFLIWTVAIVSLAIFLFLVVKHKFRKIRAGWLFFPLFVSSVIALSWQSIPFGLVLFANRQVSKGKQTKVYEASFMAGDEHSFSNFFLVGLSGTEINSDPGLKAKLYRPGLEPGDTLHFPMNTGLFGIPYMKDPLPKQ